MPELPEVETVARSLAPHLSGAVVASVEERRAGMVEGDRARFFASLPGAHITGVTRRGKLILCPLALPPQAALPPATCPPDQAMPADTLVFHLKMSGSLLIQPENATPGAHTRVLFRLADGQQLFFDDPRTFGYCRLMNAAEQTSWPFFARLGPEPLTLTRAAFIRRLSPLTRPLKTLLLDQTVIAGIGNIYADESLFRARLHPLARPADLDGRRLGALHAAVQEVLGEAIRACGSSIRDYRDAHGQAGAFQNAFRVYGRAGQPCLACGTPLASARVAGRATVFCPACQKK